MTDYTKTIEQTISFFRPVSLNEIDSLKLMNRRDTKFWFHISKLNNILNSILDNYYILEINNKRIQEYQTIYFDTLDDSMYLSHHNGKLNRLKIRKRRYRSTNFSFLEIKQKNNQGRTNKYRINTNTLSGQIKNTESDFIQENSQFQSSTLFPIIENNFRRITLVDTGFTERCTIDLSLSFIKDSKSMYLKTLVIAEIKHDRDSVNSALVNVLKENGIYEDGFSKYCIGRALMQPDLKYNQFKPKLLRINKEFIST